MLLRRSSNMLLEIGHLNEVYKILSQRLRRTADVHVEISDN